MGQYSQPDFENQTNSGNAAGNSPVVRVDIMYYFIWLE
jgi:hypothetical protein